MKQKPHFPILDYLIGHGMQRNLAGRVINYIRKATPEFKITHPIVKVDHEPWYVFRLKEPINMFAVEGWNTPPLRIEEQQIQLKFVHIATGLVFRPFPDEFYLSYAFDAFDLPVVEKDYSTLYINIKRSGWSRGL